MEIADWKAGKKGHKALGGDDCGSWLLAPRSLRGEMIFALPVAAVNGFAPRDSFAPRDGLKC